MIARFSEVRVLDGTGKEKQIISVLDLKKRHWDNFDKDMKYAKDNWGFSDFALDPNPLGALGNINDLY